MDTALRTSLVAAYVRAQAWMLYRPVADAMVEVINQHRLGIRVPADEVAKIVAERDARMSRVQAEYDGLGTVCGARGVDGREPYVRVSGDGGAPGAIVPIHGILCKNSGAINGMSQPQGMTWDQAAEAMAAAHADVTSKWVIADIYSPGGTVAGTEDFCGRVRALRAAAGGKPVVAMIHDLGASGGYFAAAMCDEIYATEQAVVGSIASYSVIEDSSEAYAKLGVRRIVIAGGEYKGVGEEGSPVTDAQVRELTRNARETTAWFARRALIEGRGMSEEEAQKLADGRTWSGREAVGLGLIDGTTTLAELVAQMRKAAA